MPMIEEEAMLARPDHSEKMTNYTNLLESLHMLVEILTVASMRYQRL
jgi:hypothetical protein